MQANSRVLFVTQTASPWGGVETWLDTLVPKLEESGWEVFVGLAKGRRFHDPARYMEHHSFSRTIEISALTGTAEGRVRAVLRAIEQTSPDIVVPVNIADTLEAVRRLRAAAADGPKILYPLHGLGADYLLDAKSFSSVIDYAVSPSRLAAAGLTQISDLPPGRVAAIRCGVGAPRREAEPRRNDAPLVLGYVGRLIQSEKRVRELVPLCGGLRRAGIDFQLLIAGSGDEEAFLRSQLAGEVDGGRVSFLGYLNPVELYDRIYPFLDVLLLFSDRETGPLVVWEAMRHGAVPVTVKYLGLSCERKLQSDFNAMISPIGDIEEMVQNIGRLDRNRRRLAMLKKNASVIANREFDLAESLEKWEAVFWTCLSLPERRGGCAVPKRPPAGRLDEWLGSAMAETVRGFLQFGVDHRDSGGEWPHSTHFGSPLAVSVDEEIARLDCEASQIAILGSAGGGSV